MAREIGVEGVQYTEIGTEEYGIEGVQANEDQAVEVAGLSIPVAMATYRRLRVG